MNCHFDIFFYPIFLVLDTKSFNCKDVVTLVNFCGQNRSITVTFGWSLCWFCVTNLSTIKICVGTFFILRQNPKHILIPIGLHWFFLQNLICDCTFKESWLQLFILDQRVSILVLSSPFLTDIPTQCALFLSARSFNDLYLSTRNLYFTTFIYRFAQRHCPQHLTREAWNLT